MESLRKQLLSLMLSLELGVISRFYKVPRKKYDDELPHVSPTIVDVIECEESCFDYDKNDKDSISTRIDNELDNQMRKGCMGIRMLFANFRFLCAILTKKSDVITLILEQYYIEGKINGTTIEAILCNKNFKFNEDERNTLQSYIDSDSKRIVLA